MMPLRAHCMRPLTIKRNVEGAKESVALLREYGFTRDDAFESMPEFGLGKERGAFQKLKKNEKCCKLFYYNSCDSR